ncbi:beta-galactosidase GalB [Roseibacillus persicicus]|uniref:beta-galactosidase GalB n=1 Tax=Roseibacillus persicicus TaxID=454148 RepID=UPI00280CB7E7|nr:beta-galactosidase GalB [Roseibacillus persicicus]MDQ8192392.1 beta-galactosidase GalB [Roseibacillus persicicus]
MKRLSHLACTLLSFFCFTALIEARERVSFNEGWRFLNDEAEEAQSSSFDDSQWRTLNLPHDWAIEGPFDVKYNARSGGLPFHGTGWYRKTFEVPAELKNSKVAVEFDGAMYNAHVWINDHFLGARPFGYIGFEYDLTPYLNFGSRNVIAVKLAPEDLSSRWYPGAGLYRNTWLNITTPVRVPHWGTFVTTPTISDELAEVRVRTEILSEGKSPVALQLHTSILDPEGKAVSETSLPLHLLPGETRTYSPTLEVPQPQRWDVTNPVLYTAVTRITDGTLELDRYETPFGIRTVEYRAGEGLILNGRHVRINGVCMHHDLGALGAAVNMRATERQLEIMQAMGANSIRTAHNPPSPEVLEVCDRLGLLVQVEAFDCWQMAKIPNGYNKFFDAWHERDLRDMIRRDRNHPSVIMWSIGNEILEQGKKDGWKLARHLHRICKDEDPTRLTSAGFNYYPASVKNGLAAEVDIPGLNYKPLAYAEVTAQYPDWHLLASETSSCTSTRGVYHLPIEKYKTHPSLHVTSYDLIGPSWAYPPDIEFRFLAETPSVLGEYIWTGFDYLGEPTPYGGRDNSTNGYWNDDWPARSSSFGAVDLCGFPKDRFFLYQSQWTDVKDKPMVHLLPHWNWEGMEGRTIPVYVYTNAPEAELFLNGKSLGRKKKGADTTALKVAFNNWDEGDYNSPYRLSWDVPYQAGELKTIAYLDGKAVAEKAFQTAGSPAKLALSPDRSVIAADGSDLSFVTIRVLDQNGNFCPLANVQVNFRVDGPGELIAVDNGDSASTESFQAPTRKTFNGLALAVIRSKKGEAGAISLTATASNLTPIHVEIQSK